MASIDPATRRRRAGARRRLRHCLHHSTDVLLGFVVLGIALAVSACSQEQVTDGDYLSSDLRTRVEELIEEEATAPTAEENAVERARIVRDWGSAYALAGGVIPVNLTSYCARIMGSERTHQPLRAAGLSFLDDTIEELALKDRQPDALGTLTVAAETPLRAASWVTIEQTWTVGRAGMRTGGALLLGKQLVADQGRYQHTEPAGDNYVSIRSSNDQARFERTTFPLGGMHGGFRGPEPMPAFRLAEGTLEPGDTVTVVYGERSGGSRGFLVQSFSTDQLLLPIYLDLGGEQNFLTPRWPGLDVEGREAVRIGAVAPSVVAAGEEFSVAVRIEDEYYNRASDPVPEIQVFLNGEAYSVLAARHDPLQTLTGVTIDEPGIYRFSFRSADGSLSGASNPMWVEESPDLRVFWGETHGHTGFAEGQGSPEHYYLYARDDARLDFAGLSEHDVWLDDAEWKTMRELARSFTVQGEFIAYLGYEWTSPRQLGGHHNVFFRIPDHDRVGVERAPVLPDLYQGLHACCRPEDVLVIPHAHQAADWTQSDEQLEKLVEMYSMHGTFEWFANLYLKNGFEVGLVAASDDHRARPGYAHGIPAAPLAQFGGLAAVWAPARTSDAIFDALRGLSAYATSGPRILLEATLNGAPMGTRQDMSERRQVEARASGTAPIDRIDVIKNGNVVFSQSYLAASLESRATLQIGFESSSEVFSGRDNPRPYRIWDGTLVVRGAQVEGVDAAGFDNVYLEYARQDEDEPNRIRFRTETRGRTDVMLVDLVGASARTTLDIHLEPSTEYGYAPVLVRPPAQIPGADLTLRLANLVDSRLESSFRVDEHTDRIQVQVVDPQAPLDRELEFIDLDEPAAGDYYYVRVSQLDGSRAWSSPFWVGEREESH